MMSDAPISTRRKVVAAFVGILIAIGAAHWYIRKNAEEPVLCPADAFQCPDGSYVGRRGPLCALSPCPNQESFTGILKQDASGFWLILGAPEGGMEVAYAMPLTVNVSNVIGQLVGKNVRVYGSFTEGAELAVDRLEGLSGDAGNPTLGEVAVGESIFVNGVRITLNRIVQDSRCAVNVQCVWAGNVTANVTLKSNTDNETRDIVSDAAPVGFDSYQISIVKVKPLPVAGPELLKPERYLVTFRVRAN